MTPQDFAAWRERMRWTQSRAAAELGITARMVKMYEKGTHPSRRDARGRAAPIVIPRAIALACAALEAGLAA